MSEHRPTNPFLPNPAPDTRFERGAPPRASSFVHPLLGNRANLQGVGRVHVDTFVVFRRWESCKQCKDDVLGPFLDEEEGDFEEEGGYPRRPKRGPPTVELPPDTYYPCPHVQKREYEALVERIQRDNLDYVPPVQTVMKDGSVQITLQWTERPVVQKEGGPRI